MKTGRVMLTICDTHVLLFWADQRDRLTQPAFEALEKGLAEGKLGCVSISFWEIAMLFRKKRLSLPAQHSPVSYMEDIIESLGLSILPITPSIVALAESGIVAHGDPGDRLIAATAIAHQAALITADKELRSTPGLRWIW
jgi:PIN domain nuclease of toxin-antitoxin system